MGNGEEVIKTWNSSCMGGTLIWQRIAEDLQVNPVSKSSQAEVKLLIITDGHDTDSRGEYHGIFGCRKLAADIAELGIDAEIHIVSLGVTDVVVLSEYEDLTSWSGGEVFTLEDLQDPASLDTKIDCFRAYVAEAPKEREARRNRRRKLFFQRTKTRQMDNAVKRNSGLRMSLRESLLLPQLDLSDLQLDEVYDEEGDDEKSSAPSDARSDRSPDKSPVRTPRSPLSQSGSPAARGDAPAKFGDLEIDCESAGERCSSNSPSNKRSSTRGSLSMRGSIVGKRGSVNVRRSSIREFAAGEMMDLLEADRDIKDEAERKRLKEELERIMRLPEEERRRAEEELRLLEAERLAEELARQEAEEQARLAALEQAKLKAQEEARLKREEERRRMEEQAKRLEEERERKRSEWQKVESERRKKVEEQREEAQKRQTQFNEASREEELAMWAQRFGDGDLPPKARQSVMNTRRSVAPGHLPGIGQIPSVGRASDKFSPASTVPTTASPSPGPGNSSGMSSRPQSQASGGVGGRRQSSANLAQNLSGRLTQSSKQPGTKSMADEQLNNRRHSNLTGATVFSNASSGRNSSSGQSTSSMMSHRISRH